MTLGTDSCELSLLALVVVRGVRPAMAVVWILLLASAFFAAVAWVLRRVTLPRHVATVAKAGSILQLVAGMAALVLLSLWTHAPLTLWELATFGGLATVLVGVPVFATRALLGYVARVATHLGDGSASDTRGPLAPRGTWSERWKTRLVWLGRRLVFSAGCLVGLLALNRVLPERKPFPRELNYAVVNANGGDRWLRANLGEPSRHATLRISDLGKSEFVEWGVLASNRAADLGASTQVEVLEWRRCWLAEEVEQAIALVDPTTREVLLLSAPLRVWDASPRNIGGPLITGEPQRRMPEGPPQPTPCCCPTSAAH